jgi:uncharacterized protein YcsI (UPF0317 family)
MVWAGQIDEERYRLDNGITNNWTGWRKDFATFLVDCIGFTPEEAMNYDHMFKRFISPTHLETTLKSCQDILYN